jgi:hypothetical protein
MILKEKFQLTYQNVVEYIPKCYMDSLLRALIVILPSEGTSMVHTFGWDFFSSKIPFYNSQTIENKETMVIITESIV